MTKIHFEVFEFVPDSAASCRICYVEQLRAVVRMSVFIRPKSIIDVASSLVAWAYSIRVNKGLNAAAAGTIGIIDKPHQVAWSFGVFPIDISGILQGDSNLRDVPFVKWDIALPYSLSITRHGNRIYKVVGVI